MRFSASLLVCSLALGLSEVAQADHQQNPASKLSFDQEEQKRERRRHKNRKTLEQRGIKLRDDYEQARKLLDISKDLHPHEHRHLAARYQRKLEMEEQMKAKKARDDEDLAYWGRFLQTDNSLPTASPMLPLPNEPTVAPVVETEFPTASPVTPTGTDAPTASPVVVPTATDAPTASPVEPIVTAEPTASPVTPTGTDAPTAVPVAIPTATDEPTASPVEPIVTAEPTAAPVVVPTSTDAPTAAPVVVPTATDAPTAAPVVVTAAPTGSPTAAPVVVTAAPTSSPTAAPVVVTAAPTSSPTAAPVIMATPAPTGTPTRSPTGTPTVAPTVNRARQVILPVALFGGTEFDDPTTHQSKALAWLEGSDLDPFSDDKLIQRYSLASIYYATYNVSTSFTDAALGAGNIFPWNTARDWLSDLDECTWSNVLCDDTTGFIVRMDFFGNFLTGEFPPEVTYLKGSLTNIDVSDNPVFTRGETFNSWLGTLTNLERLRYENTNFINANGIPTEIGNLKKLGFYECSNVRYVGTISSLAFPSDMTQLSYLEMEFNTFNSPIPTQLALVPNLQFFYTRGSSITGNLEFMRGMQSIRECWTDRNPDMTGDLPTFFDTLTTLGSLSVTRSGWSGTLPSELGSLVDSMRQMYFYNNVIGGTVPSEWGALTNLEDLELQNNLLTGQIPQQVCFLKFTRGLNLEADCEICPTNCCSDCVA